MKKLRSITNERRLRPSGHKTAFWVRPTGLTEDDKIAALTEELLRHVVAHARTPEANGQIVMFAVAGVMTTLVSCCDNAEGLSPAQAVVKFFEQMERDGAIRKYAAPNH